MNVEFINPFINSALNVLKTMAKTTPNVGKPAVKPGNRTWGVVTGIIGLAGETVSGNMVLSFDAPSILRIVSNMLGEEFKEVNNDVVDAVGELTNMISGGAKGELSEKGHKFDMATPIMVTGKDLEIKQLSDIPVITVPFTTDAGKFVIEANLAARK